MNDQNGRYTRLRHTAIGAIAALAAVGAIAGTAALAANPHANAHGEVVAAGDTAKAPASGNAGAVQASANQQFLADVQRLVNDGTITTTEAQVVDRGIRAGGLDTRTLVSSGFTPSQIQAVQQALSSTKRALAGTAAMTAGGAAPARSGATTGCGLASAASAGPKGSMPASAGPKGSMPASAGPKGNGKPPQDASQAFLTAIQRLVSAGTISSSQAQAVDREILAGSIDQKTLASAGFTQSQLRAVNQALVNVKRSL